MKSLYLLVNLGSVIVPFLFSFHPKLRFDRHFKPYILANIISAGIFLVWDAIFTQKGIWGFSDRYTLGPRVAGMPLEEVMFFFCIPFACVFTFHCLSIFRQIRWNQKAENYFFIFFSLFLLSVGIWFHDRAYTSITCIGTALLVMVFRFIFKTTWLAPFFSIYPILLIPFFIVNGILTGTGLDEPVVWYDNAENLGIRMGTIPIEDTVYGLELIILTLFFFEIFKTKWSMPENTSSGKISVLLAFLVLSGCSPNKPLPTVKSVDLARYSGKWYEIASFPQRFQKGCHCTTAEYTPKPEGYIEVLNSCRKDSVSGKLSTAIGKAFIEQGTGNAKLEVQFFWPFRGKYWIIDLADDYSYAVVGHPNREYLWVLSRTPHMGDSLYHAILGRAQAMDFDTLKLQITKQI